MCRPDDYIHEDVEKHRYRLVLDDKIKTVRSDLTISFVFWAEDRAQAEHIVGEVMVGEDQRWHIEEVPDATR